MIFEEVGDLESDAAKRNTESLDFSELESVAWNKYKKRRYYQEKQTLLSSHKTYDFKTWILIVLTGFSVACTGAFVIVLTDACFGWKYDIMNQHIKDNNYGQAFASYVFINIFFALCAGVLCILAPPAAGSGIPEIKAFLNGVKLDGALNFFVLIAKVFGMCLSVASSLPLGKEGPMIHVGSIIGAIISQGLTTGCVDFPLINFQDFRNDFTKRDFITIGAAAGVAAAFKAPIGGILFTLEEGASFWSLPLTISAFICAAITELTISLIFARYNGDSQGSFAFGQFDTLVDGRSNYYTYELFIFIIVGAGGGM
jgi:chloride channel 7